MSVEQAREENAYALGLQAFLWGYLLRYYALSSPKAMTAGGAYLNELRKYPELKTAKDRFIVTPNNGHDRAPRRNGSDGGAAGGVRSGAERAALVYRADR